MEDNLDIYTGTLEYKDIEFSFVFDKTERLSDQRNHYAHGDLDIDFIDLSLLDVVYMERILYAMQLKYHGVTKGNIQKAINALFRCGIMLTTEES